MVLVGVVILVMVLSMASLVLGLWVYLGYDHIPSLMELSYDDGEVLEFDYIIGKIWRFIFILLTLNKTPV
jgi:hypothetical protein